jgi:glutamate racemase
MATERAVKSAYLDRLVAEFAADCRVTRVAATELIRTIEADPFMDDTHTYERLLEDIRGRFSSQGVDTIVLGCTHFLMIKPDLLASFSRDFRVVDSRQGVTNRTLHLLEAHGRLEAYRSLAPGEAGLARFHLTGDLSGPSVYQRVADAYGLEFGGTL